MGEYVNMWKNYANFIDRTNVRGYWMAVLFNVIAAFVLGFLSGLIGFPIIAYLYSLAVLVPGLALSVRRLRDTGRPWTHIFFGLIPIAGGIILLVFLCKPSIPNDGTPVV